MTLFGVLMIAAFVALVAGFLALATRWGMGDLPARCVVAGGAVLGGLAGALVPGWLATLWVPAGALSSIGLGVGALVGGSLGAWAQRLRWTRTMDALVTASAPAWIIGRLGCVLVCEHPGRPVSAWWWSRTFADGVVYVDLARVELTVACLLTLALGIGFRRLERLPAGLLALLVAATWVAARVLVYALRASP